MISLNPINAYATTIKHSPRIPKTILKITVPITRMKCPARSNSPPGPKSNGLLGRGVSPKFIKQSDSSLGAISSHFKFNNKAIDKNTEYIQIVKEGNAKALNKLIKERNKFPFDINCHAPDGYTPLHIASENGNISIINLLFQYGAHVDSTNFLKRTPLHIACIKYYSK
jgi:hypothetical protein